MIKKLLLAFCAISLSLTIKAQDFEYGEHSPAEMDMKQYDKDTSAHAVVLREYGHAFVENDDFSLAINLVYHVKIKIFDSKGYDHGNIALYLSQDEHVQNIRGVTFFKDDNGVEQRTDLNIKNIYTEANGDGSVVKFTLPNVHNNCIIEYAYTKINHYQRNFQKWLFQWDIPKIHSEYVTEIPAFFSYNILLRGNLKLTKKETTIEKSCVIVDDAAVTAGCYKTIYAIDNIPAFVKEEYTIGNKNYLSALQFEQYAFRNGNGDNTVFGDEWPKLEKTLLTGERFGQQIARKGYLQSVLPKGVADISDTLERARAVYTTIQKLIKFNGEYGKYSPNIKTTIEKHSGSSADINLTLIGALAAVGINVEPVILSTIENGVTGKVSPTLNEFNYVIAKVFIDSKPYLLDATDPLLPFGMLPINCIYDQGRVIPFNKPSYWINLAPTEKNKTIVQLDMTILDNGKVKGTVTRYSFGYAAYLKRLAIKKHNSIDEYVENLDNRATWMKIIRSNIANIDSLDQPLAETYEVEINSSDNFNTEKNFEFSPAFWSQIRENPFIQAKRSYPVYWGYLSDHKVILNMHYPANYQIVNKPADVGLLLPDKGGMFATKFLAMPGGFNYSETTQVNKTMYSPEEYPYLKEFYNKIIQTQKATIEFTKQ